MEGEAELFKKIRKIFTKKKKILENQEIRNFNERQDNGVNEIDETPIVQEDSVAKKFIISPVFSYSTDLTLEQAAFGISKKIAENGGMIPVDWVKFGELPHTREENWGAIDAETD